MRGSELPVLLLQELLPEHQVLLSPEHLLFLEPQGLLDLPDLLFAYPEVFPEPVHILLSEGQSALHPLGVLYLPHHVFADALASTAGGLHQLLLLLNCHLGLGELRFELSHLLDELPLPLGERV